MAHFPLNHPLRPLYRTLAGLTGTYILIFGCVGLTKTVGQTLFARESTWTPSGIEFVDGSVSGSTAVTVAWRSAPNASAAPGRSGGGCGRRSVGVRKSPGPNASARAPPSARGGRLRRADGTERRWAG